MKTPPPPPKPKVHQPAVKSLDSRRTRAQSVLWWRMQTLTVFQVWFLGLLVVDVALGVGLVLTAWSESRNVLDLSSRLFGDAEEAAWLGWAAYFAWVFFDRMNRARMRRRSARIARMLLKRGHSRWYYPLAAT